MKKYLFLMLSILSIFFISDRVEALSFKVQDKDIEVTEDNFIYYCYYLHNNILEHENIITYLDNYNHYGCLSFDNDINNYSIEFYRNSSNYDIFFWYHNNPYSEYLFYDDFSVYTEHDSYNGTNGTGIYFKKIINNTFDIYKYQHSDNLYKSSNLKKEDIKKYFDIKSKYKIIYYLNNEIYKEIEVEEGSNHTLEDYSYNKDLYVFSGWSVDDNKDLSNITSDISIRATLQEKEVNAVYVKNFPETQVTKNEFYSLLVLLATLIMIIFLKWCFPFKGGKDL